MVWKAWERNLVTAKLATLLCLLLAGSCARRSDPVLATVQGIPIRYSDVLWELQDHGRLRPGETPTRRQIEEITQRLVERKLRYREGMRRGYERDPQVAPYVDAQEKDLAYKLYRQEKVIDKLITERDLWSYYCQQAERVRIRHILVRVAEDAPAAQDEKARNRIEDIRTQILAGASFAEMAARYSDEAQTASQGGDWGFIRRGTGRFDPIFYDVAFSLRPGQLSKPFRTRVGWHLLLCEAHEKPSKADFRAKKQALQEELLRVRAEAIDSAMFALRDQLFRRYGMRFNDEGIALLMDRIRSTAFDSTGKAPQRRQITVSRQLERVRAEDLPIWLCRWDGGSYTIGDLVQDIEQRKEYRRPLLDTEQNLRDWLLRVASIRVLTAEAFRLGYHRRPEVRQELDRRREILVASKFDAVEITGPSVPAGEEELRAFYESHKDQFLEPAKAKVQEIYIRSDRDLAERVADMARKGANFEELARQYNQRTITQGKNGWLGYISEDMYGEVGKVALQLRPGQIAGPIPMGNNFSVIRVVDRKPPYLPSFEEAKAKVRAAYIRAKRQELEAKWSAELRRRYPVVVYSERIARLGREE
ncbi:MAG: peptidylprolyl isomerase [candidate division KSB1 bacterium]|nr:peptidylprolyl isomerase [candidate division KSB1 bacterium]